MKTNEMIRNSLFLRRNKQDPEYDIHFHYYCCEMDECVGNLIVFFLFTFPCSIQLFFMLGNLLTTYQSYARAPFI